jgi:hypothetical protein
MASDIDSKVAQLLNQTPDFRAAGADLRRDFRSAYNHGGMIDEKADNASQPGVSLCRSLLGQARCYARSPN